MTPNELKSNLAKVLQALNSVTVSGKANLANLAGSISVLEEVLRGVSEESPQGDDEKNE